MDEGMIRGDFFLYILIWKQSCCSTINLCCWCILYKQWTFITAVGGFFWKWPCKGRWTHCVMSLMLQSLNLMLLSASKDCACFTSQYNIPTFYNIFTFFKLLEVLNLSKGLEILNFKFSNQFYLFKMRVLFENVKIWDLVFSFAKFFNF